MGPSDERVWCGECETGLGLGEAAEHGALIHLGSATGQGGVWACGVCGAEEEELGPAVAHALAQRHSVHALAFRLRPALHAFLAALQTSNQRPNAPVIAAPPPDPAQDTKPPKATLKAALRPKAKSGDQAEDDQPARRIGCTNCRRVFHFNSARDAARHGIQCAGFQPYSCSACPYQASTETRLRTSHLAMEHSGGASAVLCGPVHALEMAIRASLDRSFPFHPVVAKTWPGLDPSAQLPVEEGREARSGEDKSRFTYGEEAAIQSQLPQDYDGKLWSEEEAAESQAQTEERPAKRARKDSAAAGPCYAKKAKPKSFFGTDAERVGVCQQCERPNHIHAARDGRVSPSAVLRHSIICGGFRPFLCTLCPFSNPVRYEVKCHIRRAHGADPNAAMRVTKDLILVEGRIRDYANLCFPQYAHLIAQWKGIRGVPLPDDLVLPGHPQDSEAPAPLPALSNQQLRGLLLTSPPPEAKAIPETKVRLSVTARHSAPDDAQDLPLNVVH